MARGGALCWAAQLCTTYFEMHALIVPNVDCFRLAGQHKVHVQERIYRVESTDWKLYHSSYVLGDLLLREPLLAQVKGRTVMELGSGLGLGGLAATHAAASVTLTDRRTEVLRTLHCSADINSAELPELFRCERCAEQGAPRPRATCKLLRWSQEAQCSESGLEADVTFDVVVGAEVLYNRASVSTHSHTITDVHTREYGDRGSLRRSPGQCLNVPAFLHIQRRSTGGSVDRCNLQRVI
jgi:hypothetical protein